MLSLFLNSTVKDSTKAEDSVGITGISRLDQTVDSNKLGKKNHCSNGKSNDKNSIPFDVDQNINLEHTHGLEKPVWAGTEEEQLEWALAESTKSAEKESKAKLKERQETNKNETECSGKLNEHTTCNLEDEDFNLASDVSDEDLVYAAHESGPDEAYGLRGGGPISATENISDDLDISILHDTSSDRNSSVNSSLEESACKGTVLKNSPILFVKRPNGNLMRRRKPQDKINTNKTPTLGKFYGNLFEDSIKENKTSLNNVSAKERPRNGLYSAVFRDEDMAKAINMSLQDQVRYVILLTTRESSTGRILTQGLDTAH